MIQWQYLKHKSLPFPSKRYLEGITRQWLKTGEAPAGYKILPRIWGKPKTTRGDIVKAKQGRKLGNLRPGKVSHYHEPNVTLCDYDTSKQPTCKGIWELARKLKIKPLAIEYKRSSSGKGWHVITTWDRDFSPVETVCIQLLLGSDPKREAFNLARIFAGWQGDCNNWNFLFSAKCK